MNEPGWHWNEVLADEYGDGHTSLVCFGRFTKKEVRAITSGGIYRMQERTPTMEDTWYAPTNCLCCGRMGSNIVILHHNSGYLCEKCRDDIKNGVPLKEKK